MTTPLKGLADMKVKDVPQYVKEVVTKENVKRSTWSFLQSYGRKYIHTSSIRPLHDVFILVGLCAYAVNWPREIRHLQEHEALLKKGEES